MSFELQENKYPKNLIIIVVAGILAVAAVITAAFATSDIYGVEKGGRIVITEGMTVKKAADSMKQSGIIRFPLAFRLISRIKGYDTKIHTGQVEITEGMSYNDILYELINAQPETVKIVIPEGLEIKEIADRFSSLVSKDEFYKALEKDYDYAFLKDLPDREVKLEGYLFPATYEFTKDVTAEQIVDTMLKTFNESFPEEYYSRSKELGMTVDSIITLASIIERESNSGEDRAKVAGVFYNRLKSNMRLQSCATVQYALKERKAVLSTQDTKINSPYNTYIHDGLPIGPISSPGGECIKAALYPEETDALYFVLGSDGKHIFSKTFEEHIQAKNAD